MCFGSRVLCVLLVACFALCVACRVLRVVCCALPVVYCALSVACCVRCAGMSRIGRCVLCVV